MKWNHYTAVFLVGISVNAVGAPCDAFVKATLKFLRMSASNGVIRTSSESQRWWDDGGWTDEGAFAKPKKGIQEKTFSQSYSAAAGAEYEFHVYESLISPQHKGASIYFGRDILNSGTRAIATIGLDQSCRINYMKVPSHDRISEALTITPSICEQTKEKGVNPEPDSLAAIQSRFARASILSITEIYQGTGLPRTKVQLERDMQSVVNICDVFQDVMAAAKKKLSTPPRSADPIQH